MREVLSIVPSAPGRAQASARTGMATAADRRSACSKRPGTGQRYRPDSPKYYDVSTKSGGKDRFVIGVAS